MYENEQQMINACMDEPSLVFKFISNGYYEVIEKMIDENIIDVNLEDCVGNDVVTRLLKARQYDLVERLMKKRNWNVNHKNSEGNTFGHVLAQDNSICAVKVVELLNKKKNYSPNVRNNRGETIFDRALNGNYLCTAIKILQDKRFTSIDISSFKILFDHIFKCKDYGKYMKLNTLEIIVDNLEKKELDPEVSNIVEKIVENMDIIKRDIMNNNSKLLNTLINSKA